MTIDYVKRQAESFIKKIKAEAPSDYNKLSEETIKAFISYLEAQK